MPDQPYTDSSDFQKSLIVNEGAKTGIYWVVAAVMLAVATFVSWPQQTENDRDSIIGEPLFASFADPLAASSLRIVKFDEGQGEVQRFEVAKDESTGVWSLPSRNNYAADAAEQMQKAANALIGLKVLDIQSDNPEDHVSLGVIEPKPDALEVGDEGVGLLVSFKGDKNSSLANLIIGNQVAGSNEKRYVRIPGQNPVYVVNMDNLVFSTKFEDWIEKDLLQLSSIDISRIDVQSYDAALESAGSLSMNRSYDASVEVDGSSDWKLLSLVRYDDQQQPIPSSLAEGEKLATAKLNELKNALDDLKIVDVAAKPKGMSENLKADKDLVSDNEAVRSLAVRGFFPVNSGDILSANGEMSVTLNDGVQYVLRFGNVQGLSEEGEPANGEAGGKNASGANRYLLVTAQVDESKFPAPDLKPIPKTVEELDAMNQPAPTPAAEQTPPGETVPPTPAPASTPDAPAAEIEAAKPAEPASSPEVTKPTESATPAPDTPAETPAAALPAEPAVPADAPADTATESSADACQDDENAADQPAENATPAVTEAPSPDEPAPPAQTPAEAPKATAEQPVETETKPQPAPAVVETAEEKQERLEAEQEKITKENQRKLDERKDRLEAARRRVRELNGRFADWYYVIPESTYRKLRIPNDELVEKPEAPNAAAGDDPSSAAPTFNLPGLGN